MPTRKSPKFICRDLYKLYATVNATGSDNKTSSTFAYSLICTSVHKNLFCMDTSDVHWKRRQCSIAGSKIECPLFVTYKTYSEFFLWKISTFAIKIVYKIDRKTYITVDKPVTPYFKCPNIVRVGPHDKMFPASDHKHDDVDCSH